MNKERSMIDKQVERIAEAVISDDMAKEDVWQEFERKKMSRSTFERRWKRFMDKSASYYKHKQMKLIGEAVAFRKKLVDEAWDLYEAGHGHDGVRKISDLYTVNKVQAGLEDLLIKTGVVDAAAEKLEVSNSTPLIVNYPKDYIRPKKDEIR